ncbi:LysR family transcriptional regulator [Naumannella huperziae]
MDVAQLRAFLAVAEELHFGRAAERLHIAQPPLSRMIRQLERGVGAQLFDRTTRRVSLTAQGAALVEPARAVLAALDAARLAVRSAGEGEVGTVRISFTGPSTQHLISRLARAVRNRHPGIDLVLQSHTYGAEAVGLILAGRLDLALLMTPGPPPGMAARPMRRGRFVVVLPDSHPLAGRAELAMAELAEEPWVAFPPSAGSVLREEFVRLAADRGFVPRIVQEAPDTWSKIALVASGVGITLNTDLALDAMGRDGIVVVPLADDVEASPTQLIWREADPNPALRRVLALSADLADPAAAAPRGR